MYLDEDGLMQVGVPPPAVQDAAQHDGVHHAQNTTSATSGPVALDGVPLAGDGVGNADVEAGSSSMSVSDAASAISNTAGYALNAQGHLEHRFVW